MKYSISYDISSTKRRTRVANILLGCSYRVQKSVFEGYFTKRELQCVVQRISKEIDRKTDSVRFYPLCGSCADSLLLVGCGQRIEQIGYLVL